MRFKSKMPSMPSSLVFKEMNATNISEICDVFADYFESVYDDNSGCNDISKPWTKNVSKVVNIGSFFITNDQVCKCLSKWKVKKGSGPDMVPSFILKSCRESLSEPLCFIFNESLASGIFPSMWKGSFITAIFKSARGNVPNRIEVWPSCLRLQWYLSR